METQNLDYNKMADTYACHRPASLFVLDELQQGWRVCPESKVLEVGCGTGSYLQALVKTLGCQGWGIDPSRQMINFALSDDSVHFLEGSAEELPFQDGFFDFAFSVDVIHHLRDTMAYFQEALRVLGPGGVTCTVTDSEEIIKNRKPLAQYWPGTVAADLMRYPAISSLRQQMVTAGFKDIEEHEIQRTFEVTDVTPYRERAYSCLHLISEEEFLIGLRHLETDLKASLVQGISEYICLWGQHPA